jgi:hypothetical protein
LKNNFSKTPWPKFEAGADEKLMIFKNLALLQEPMGYQT